MTLIHDRFDGLVPLRHAERLHSELARAPGGERHRLVVTELLSHLTPSRALDVVGLARLAAALAPLVSADARRPSPSLSSAKGAPLR